MIYVRTNKVLIILNKILILFMITILFLGCGEKETKLAPVKKVVNTLDKSIIDAYQIYVEKTLSYRVVAYKLFDRLEGKEILNGSQLNAVHEMLERYLNAKSETAYRIQAYQYIVDGTDDTYTRKEQFELVMMSLSTMLLRYDDYFIAYSKYKEDSKLNEVMNFADSAYNIPQNTLEDDILYRYEIESERDDLDKMIEYYKQYLRLYQDDKNSDFIYLRALIEDSPSYQLGLADTSFFGSITDWIVDLRNGVFSTFFNTISETIGNTAGLVEIRKGKLYGDDAVATNVNLNLQVGDILVERTPFRLTDKLIPGYFGHIAVYIGTENDLKEMGIWDDIDVKWQADISQNKGIVEALRDGVQLNTVEHFLNVDDLSIMHDERETQEEKISRIRLVIKQLGKEYDFEYDIEDNSKVICSELVYITSLNIEWDIDNTLGIISISPDNVAIVSTRENTVFTIPLIYHDGVLIESEPKEYMKNILEDYEE